MTAYFPETEHKYKLKVMDEKRYIELCKLRWDMELDGNTDPDDWLKLADDFEKCGALHNAYAAKKRADYFQK